MDIAFLYTYYWYIKSIYSLYLSTPADIIISTGATNMRYAVSPLSIRLMLSRSITIPLPVYG